MLGDVRVCVVSEELRVLLLCCARACESCVWVCALCVHARSCVGLLWHSSSARREGM